MVWRVERGYTPTETSVRRLALGLAICLLSACGTPPSKPVRTPKTPAANKAEREHPEPAFIPTPGLSGITWYWLGNLTPAQTLKTPDPARYSLVLKDDGWFDIRTECRQGSGIYETSGARIVLAVLNQPHQPCPRAELDTLYVDTLQAAGNYRLRDDRLYLHLQREAKTMVFYRKP